MKVPYVRYLIGWSAKKFDYINRVVKHFHLRSVRVRRHTLPSLLCISMDRSCACVEFFLFSMQRFPTVVSEPGLYARVEHKELWAMIVILLNTNVLFWFGGIMGWSGPNQPYMSTHMRLVPPTDMQLVLHKGGWRVSVSPTLVESNSTAAVLEEC